jgi:preprotein translocase subunit YajC
MSVESAGSMMGTGGGLMSLLPMVFIFAIFYFFLIRPQVKRQRKAEQMVNELKKGDKVIAAGGLYGTIAKIEDNVIFLEIADGVRIKALKTSVTETLSGSATAPKLVEKETKEVEAKKTTKTPAKKLATKKPVVKKKVTKK